MPGVVHRNCDSSGDPHLLVLLCSIEKAVHVAVHRAPIQNRREEPQGANLVGDLGGSEVDSDDVVPVFAEVGEHHDPHLVSVGYEPFELGWIQGGEVLDGSLAKVWDVVFVAEAKDGEYSRRLDICRIRLEVPTISGQIQLERWKVTSYPLTRSERWHGGSESCRPQNRESVLRDTCPLAPGFRAEEW